MNAVNDRGGVFAIAWLMAAAVSAAADVPVQTILCVGDSITAADPGWVKLVGEHAAIDTINAGQGGRQTPAAAETFATAVADGKKFDRVIFLLGVNDLPARNPAPPAKKIADCVAGMEKALDAALLKLKPQDVILVAPCSVNAEIMRKPPGADPRMAARCERNQKKGYDICQPLLQELEQAYRALAAKKGVRFVSLLAVVSPENLPDGLHPNAAGHREIAATLTPALLEPSGPRRRK
jgi:lysophospholipase L1-like esterase